MTDLRSAAQQALEALYEETAWFGPTPKGAAAIAALKAALAQQAEPVAWLTPGQDLHLNNGEGFRFSDWTPLYPAPPQRLPLTEEEIYEMYNEPRSDAEMVDFARAVERAHGIGETQ